jgi:hypothetical protein
MLEEPQEPVFTDEQSLAALPPKRGLLDADASKQKILILPTGSLYGLRADSAEHSALQSYVEQGGVVVCFTQAYGDDFSALPVPNGEELLAAGYKQDVSCFSGSAYPAMDHPVLSGITTLQMGCNGGACGMRPGITAGMDGFFRKAPGNAVVLLRRTISGEPCLIIYQVGQGYVVASTMYEDWAYGNGQSTKDGRSVLANILAWARAPGQPMPATNLSAGGSSYNIPLALHVHNFSGQAADQIEVVVTAPDRKAQVAQVSQSFSIPAGSEADVPVTLDLASYFAQAGSPGPQYGIFHADYRLLALNSASGQEEEIQPQGEAVTGRFVVEKPDATRQGLSQTIFSAWTDTDAAGNPAGSVHLHLEDLTGTARTLHLWEAYNHDNGFLLQTINLPPGGTWNLDLPQDLTRAGTYRYYAMDGVYGLTSYVGQWANLFGYDPWKMAAMAAVYLRGDRNGELAQIVSLAGLQQVPYKPTDTVAGTATLLNPRTVAADFTVVFSLTAAGQTTTQTQVVHVEPGAAQPVNFSFALPGPITHYNRAVVSVSVFIGPNLVTGTSRNVAVEIWFPDLALAPLWPDQTTLATLGEPLVVRVVNQAGPRVANAETSLLRAIVRDVSSQTIVEDQFLPLPVLRPGDSTDVTVPWAQWQPILGKTYDVEFGLYAANQMPQGAFQSKVYNLKAPGLSAGGYAWTRPGDVSVAFQGAAVNTGDLAWIGSVVLDCPSLAANLSQSVTIPPNSTTPLSWSVPRPDALAPGVYPYTVTLTALGLPAPVTAQGTLEVQAPSLGLAWPETPPSFRHDQDASLPLSLTVGDAAAPLPGTLDVTMSWSGGSVRVAAGVPVTLDPAQPAAISLSLPMAQMAAPGPFTVQVSLHIPQGNVTQSWSASYELKGPDYSGGFSTLTVAPGAPLVGQIQNTGAFEGNAQVGWSLADAKGIIVAQDNQTLPVGIGATVSLTETLPQTLLPGMYQSTLIVTDGASSAARSFSQAVTIAGTWPALALSTDRSVYGTADQVALTLHVEDASHALEGASAHLEVQRYIGNAGAGGTQGSPGASWNTPAGDGSGNYVVNPSQWFVDSSGASAAYLSDVSAELPFSFVPPVASDVNGDGKADFIAIESVQFGNGASEPTLIIASEGDLGAGFAKTAVRKPGKRAGTGERLTAGGDSCLAQSMAAPNTQQAFDPWWLYLPVIATWGLPADAWDGSFMLGFRDDIPGGVTPFCIGMNDSKSGAAVVLMAKLDGTVLWRHDFPAPFSPYCAGGCNTWSAAGPVFVDLNGDGVKDVLFRGAETLVALNGQNGQALWTVPFTGTWNFSFRLGRGLSGHIIWVAANQETGDTLTLLDKDGHVQYQTSPAGGLSPESLVTGDLDGDGNDEAVIVQAWQDGQPTVEVFSVSSPTPIATTVAPYSRVSLSDINGDGRAEALLAIAGQNPDGSFLLLAEAVDLLGGQTLWATPMSATDAGSDGSFITYTDRSGGKKLLFEAPPTEAGPSIFCLMSLENGAIGQILESGRYWSGDILAADFDGDGVSEFYEGGALLDNGCLDPGGVAGPCAEWETVWQTDDTLSENGQSTLDVSYKPGAMAVPGTYRAVAIVTTTMGQELDVSPAGFSVVTTALGLSFAPSADTIVRTDEAFNGSITLTNSGDAVESSITVTLLVDGQAFTSWSVDSLDPQAQREFVYALPAAPAGKHALEIHAVENGATVADLRSAYISALPQVQVSADLPSSHTEAPFNISLTVTNTGEVATHVTLTPSDDPDHSATLELQPQETRPLTLTRQIASAYAAQVTVSGDASQTISLAVPYAYQLSMTVPDLLPQAVVSLNVPVHLAQAGPQPYSGSLLAAVTLADGTISSSTWPVQLLAGGTADLSLPVSISVPGPTRLHILASLTETSVDRDLIVYRSGIGTLQVTLPQTLGEGMAQIPFTVQNGLSAQGSFDVQLMWASGSGSEQVAAASLSLQGSGSDSGVLAPTFSRGTGTLLALLNGVVVASQAVTVLPLAQANLTLDVQQPSGAPPFVTAVIQNTGFGPLDGTLEVRADTVTATPVHVEAGAQSNQTIPVSADGFAAMEGTVTAILHLPDGTALEKNAALTFAPAQVNVTPPQGPITLIPDQQTPLAFTVANAGDKSAPVLLGVNFEDGELGHFEESAEVAGHGSMPVTVTIPLSWDIPNGLSNAHFVLRDGKDQNVVLAQGDLPVSINGPTIQASASLDGAAYPIGASATLSVALSLAPTNAQPKDVLVRVLGGNYEEERPITVSGGQNETFAVPITEGMDGVAVEVLQPGGRSLYINRFRVYPIGQGFAIHPDKSVYQGGESVQITASLSSSGSLHLNFINQDVTLTGSGTLSQSFAIPSDASEDSYSVAYDYTPSDTTVSPASGRMMIDVHGILVTGGESHLDKTIYMSGESISGQVVLYANQAISGTLKFWIVEPDGSYGYGGDQAVTLAQGATPSRLHFSLPFATTQAGTHRVAYSLVGASGTSYVAGSLPFRAGKGVILGAAPSQDAYPLGTETVSLLLRTAGNGTATAAVQLDGSETAQAAISMEGTNTTTVALGPVPPGEHTVKVTLLDALGLTSEARCRFTYGTGLPDLKSSIGVGCRSNGILPVWIEIANAGSGGAGASTASLYDGNPQSGGIVLAAFPIPALVAGQEYNFTYEWSAAGQEGGHELYLVADSQSSIVEWDETNNASSTSVTVAPPISIQVLPPDSTCAKDIITPEIMVSPEGTPFIATLNGQPYAPGTPITLEGDYQFTATSLTSCGSSAATAQANYIIDRTPPSIEILGVEDGAVYTGSVSAVFQAGDLHPGSTNATLNGVPFSSGNTISVPGNYTLTVAAADCAGNASQAAVHFAISGEPTPALPPEVMNYAAFGCVSATINGQNTLCGVLSVGGDQVFGGNIGSNGDIAVNGANVINGNATPGPGRIARITGHKNQVLGSTDPSGSVIPCEAQSMADWANYAAAHNDNAIIPAQFLDAQGRFKISGGKTCVLPGGTYLVAGFAMNGNAKLILTGPATFVVAGPITIVGSASVNEAWEPSYLTVVSASNQPVIVTGQPRVSCYFYAPLSPVTLNGNVIGYGGIWGWRISVNGSCLWERVVTDAARPDGD